MRLGQIVDAGRFALSAVSETFAPSPNATSRQVRINGAICIGLGVSSFLVFFCIMWVFGPNIPMALGLVPSLFMYASLIVGGYRLVFGASAKAEPGEGASLSRILFGIGWMVLLFGSLIAVTVIFHL